MTFVIVAVDLKSIPGTLSVKQEHAVGRIAACHRVLHTHTHTHVYSRKISSEYLGKTLS